MLSEINTKAQYTEILTWKPKWEKTTKNYYIELRFHLVYEHPLKGGYNPLALPTPIGRKHQLPSFTNTN
jgi:hypothetical protein